MTRRRAKDCPRTGPGNRVLAICVVLLLAGSCSPLLAFSAPGAYPAPAVAVAEEEAGSATTLRPFDLSPAPTIEWPTAQDIVYGQTLADSTLSGGSTEYGSFAWADGAVRPSVPGASYEVVFTPSEATLIAYEPITTLTRAVSVKVLKAPAPVIEWPTAEPLVVGGSVGEAALVGGSTEYGSFQWAPADAELVPSVGTRDFAVNFTPNAETQANYEAITTRTGTVSLTVTKAEPPDVVFPITSPIQESAGASLADVPLDGGSGDGSFAWFAPDLVPKAPGGLYDVVFTPNDTERYNTVVKKVYLAVISNNTQDESHYDSRYTSDTLAVRVGAWDGKWKTLKTYDAATIWNTLSVYDQEFTWIDDGGFLVFQAVRGVDLKDLLEDALAADGIIGDIGEGSIQMVYFHTKDTGYHTSQSPESLWNVGRYAFPTLLRDWDFRYNSNPYGDSVAWAGAVPVSPMIALEEYWHRVTEEKYRDPAAYWSEITSGARFRLAWGMPSPTTRTGHDSAKYIDRIDLVFRADVITEGGMYGEYYGQFTEDQEPGNGSDAGPKGDDGTGDDNGSGDGTGDGDGDGDGPGDGSGGEGEDGPGSGGDGDGPGDGSGGEGEDGPGNGTRDGAGDSTRDGTGEGTDSRVVELTLSDGTTVQAQELDPDALVPLSGAPAFGADSLHGAELLQAQGLSMLEMAGVGTGAGDDSGGTVTIGESGVPLVMASVDPRVLLLVNLVLAASFVSGGVSTFMTGRISWMKGAFRWISAR